MHHQKQIKQMKFQQHIDVEVNVKVKSHVNCPAEKELVLTNMNRDFCRFVVTQGGTK